MVMFRDWRMMASCRTESTWFLIAVAGLICNKQSCDSLLEGHQSVEVKN